MEAISATAERSFSTMRRMKTWLRSSMKQKDLTLCTVQKLKFPVKDFLSKCDQICKKLRIWSHLPKK